MTYTECFIYFLLKKSQNNFKILMNEMEEIIAKIIIIIMLC